MNELRALVYIFLALLGVLALAGLVIGVNYLSDRKKWSPWQKLAIANHLIFISWSWSNGGVRVAGDYRGYQVVLYTFEKSQSRNSQTWTALTLVDSGSTRADLVQRKRALLARQVVINDKEPLQALTHLTGRLPGSLTATAYGQTIYYEQRGVETQGEHLQFLLDLLGDVADIYPVVLALGGQAVLSLRQIATMKDHSLQHVATQLLYDIGQETSQRLSGQAPHLFCPHCLTRCAAHDISLGWWTSLTYYGCRSCGQSREFLTGRLVAMLDSQMAPERVEQEGVWQLNWLIHRTLFDFDEVIIKQATDEEVERLAVQVGNDTDPWRRARYPKMRCVVWPDCRLSENTTRILQRMFGQVVLGEISRRQ